MDKIHSVQSKKEFMGHPIGLYVLAMTELWERLSYYGLRGILVLYLTHSVTVNVMGWGDYSSSVQNAQALEILGWYMMAAYITPVLGGWIADNYCGERTCIFWGGTFMALGKFVMAIPYLWITGYEKTALWMGLGLLALGNGLFKPNISSMVGKLYAENDRRRDSGFTIFYMGINIGAFLGFLLIGWIAVAYGYHMAFMVSGIGMLVGMIIQMLFASKTLGVLGLVPAKKLNVSLTGLLSQNLTSLEKNKIFAVFILSFYAMLFFTIYEQIAGSFLLFTKNNTDLTIMGFDIPPSWVLSVNPALIVLIAPLVSVIFFQPVMKNIDVVYKYFAGYGLLFIAFIIAAVGALPVEADINTKVNILWPIASFIFITLAELCISPVGLSFISTLSPIRFTGLMMGVFFFFLGIGNKLSTILGKFIVGDGQGYVDGFFLTALLCVVIALTILIMRPIILKLIRGIVETDIDIDNEYR